MHRALLKIESWAGCSTCGLRFFFLPCQLDPILLCRSIESVENETFDGIRLEGDGRVFNFFLLLDLLEGNLPPQGNLIHLLFIFVMFMYIHRVY